MHCSLSCTKLFPQPVLAYWEMDLWNKSKWSLNKSTRILRLKNPFENVFCKLPTIVYRPQCVNSQLSSHLHHFLWKKKYPPHSTIFCCNIISIKRWVVIIYLQKLSGSPNTCANVPDWGQCLVLSPTALTVKSLRPLWTLLKAPVVYSSSPPPFSIYEWIF